MKVFFIKLFNRFIGVLLMIIGIHLIRFSVSINFSPNPLWMVMVMFFILTGLCVFVTGKMLNEIINQIIKFIKNKKMVGGINQNKRSKLNDSKMDEFIKEFYRWKVKSEEFMFLIIAILILAFNMNQIVREQKKNNSIESIKVEFKYTKYAYMDNQHNLKK